MSVPDIWIERVHLGEGTAAMEAAIASDPEAQAKLESLADADASFHVAFDAADQVAAIERKLHVAKTADAVSQRRRSWRPWLVGAVPLLVAGLVVMALPGSDSATVDGVRIKGDERVLVYQKGRRGNARTVTEESVFKEGDQLQLGYRTDAAFGVLLSLDGRGEVTVHFPAGDNTDLRQGERVLNHAYELDDAPAFERFFLVTDDEPMSVPQVVDAVKALNDEANPRRATLAVEGASSVVDFTILKVSR